MPSKIISFVFTYVLINRQFSARKGHYDCIFHLELTSTFSMDNAVKTSEESEWPNMPDLWG